MAYSLNLILRADKLRKADGTAPIVLRVTANRKSSQSVTGVRVEPRYWNDKKQQVRKSHHHSAALNARLEAALGKAHARLAEADTNAEALQSLKTDKASFSDFFRAHIAELDKRGKLCDLSRV